MTCALQLLSFVLCPNPQSFVVFLCILSFILCPCILFRSSFLSSFFHLLISLFPSFFLSYYFLSFFFSVFFLLTCLLLSNLRLLAWYLYCSSKHAYIHVLINHEVSNSPKLMSVDRKVASINVFIMFSQKVRENRHQMSPS